MKTYYFELWIDSARFHHNEYLCCYKLEIVIQQKQQRPHILMEHLVLQLQ